MTLSIGNFFSEGKVKESLFFGQKYQSYEDLAVLGKYYAYAYRLFAQNPKALWAGDEQKREELLRRSLEINRMLGDFGKHITSLARQTRLSRLTESSIIKIRNSEIDPNRVKLHYTARNYYGLVYLPFTASVWRLTESLQYLDRKIVKGAIGEKGGYLNYKDAIKRFSREEIDKWYIDIMALAEEQAGEGN